MNKLTVCAAGLLAVAVLASGCSSEPAKSDADVKKEFAGGPMPKEFKEKMGADQAEAQKKAQEAASKAAANH